MARKSRNLTFPIIDLTRDTPMSPTFSTAQPTVDLKYLQMQLREIRDHILPLVQPHDNEAFGLRTLEIRLTVGAEGRVFLVAKGTAEASISLTFGRGTA